MSEKHRTIMGYDPAASVPDTTCPCCGAPAEPVTAYEGTSHYRPVRPTPDEVVEAFADVKVALDMLVWGKPVRKASTDPVMLRKRIAIIDRHIRLRMSCGHVPSEPFTAVREMVDGLACMVERCGCDGSAPCGEDDLSECVPAVHVPCEKCGRRDTESCLYAGDDAMVGDGCWFPMRTVPDEVAGAWANRWRVATGGWMLDEVDAATIDRHIRGVLFYAGIGSLCARDTDPCPPPPECGDDALWGDVE